MSDLLLPRRCCLCLWCRTALFPSEACDCSPDAPTSCFETLADRERIVEQAWGSRDQREHRYRSFHRARGRATAATIGGFFAATGTGAILWGASPITAFVGIAGMAAGGAVAGLSSASVANQPQGGLEGGFPGPGPRGRVRGEHQLVSPAGAAECLAYCIELRVVAGGREALMYRDAVTTGFEVELEQGQTARIPAGRVRLYGAREVSDVDNIELESYLRAIDPLRSEVRDFDPLHFDLVREEILVSGDRIELAGALEPVASGAGAGDYRAGAPSYLSPRGVASVHLVR